eukprot:Phypoly_transcript_03019.p1 GENE.Phypoly_transcript_03019~~Phypoly_transcript_03019.p1  ORF type:complete len:661 (+),score=83.28 Phypoly_transcript_03019:571-2553(+)
MEQLEFEIILPTELLSSIDSLGSVSLLNTQKTQTPSLQGNTSTSLPLPLPSTPPVSTPVSSAPNSTLTSTGGGIPLRKRKIKPSAAPVFEMGVKDELCVKAIKAIAAFLKNYVHLPVSDLFQEKSGSEKTIFLKEALLFGDVPDFSIQYQHDPHSVAQFLYEILASSKKGILSKVGQGLVDSVDIDLTALPSLKYYKLSCMRSLLFQMDTEPHLALFYTLDLLHAFFQIQPEDSLSFFGNKFGPVFLKELPEKSSTIFSVLLSNFSAILEPKEDINIEAKNGYQPISTAGLERLFEKLLDPYYSESLFSDTFFLTYGYFISARDMLKKFTDYYLLATTGSPQKWKIQLSTRVLVLIKNWIMTHESFFQKEKQFLCVLCDFVDSVTAPSLHEAEFFMYFSKLVTDSTYSPVCTVAPSVMAMHMAMIDQSFFRLIPFSELLHKSFKTAKLSPHFHNMTNKYNDWRRWVCTEILRMETDNDRVNIVTYFVDIVKHCVLINNFNTASSLIEGLKHSSISRLLSMWKKVPAEVMQDFDKMTKLFDHSNNSKNYRTAVKDCKPPTIPVLEMLAKDLIAIEEGYITMQKGLINFHKLQLLTKLVKYVLQMQQTVYKHLPGTQDWPLLNDYLHNKLGGSAGLLVEHEMMSRSIVIQPVPQTKDEPIPL